MSSDSFFTIGKSHDICEDYACNGVFNDEIAYVIVCDGCSSSTHTDFGSRILSKSIEKNLMWLLMIKEDIDIVSNRFITDAKMFSKFIDLDYDSLNSTALISYKTKEKYKTHVYGDGVVVAKVKDGYDVYVIDFPSGAPGYMSYNPETFENYKNIYGTQRLIYKHFLNENFEVIEEKSETISCPVENPLIPYDIEYDIEKCEFIAIFSDGVQTFTKTEIEGASKTQRSICLYEIIKKFLSFKGMNGQFVKRRFKRFMKEANRLGYENFDDVSLGVVS